VGAIWPKSNSNWKRSLNHILAAILIVRDTTFGARIGTSEVKNNIYEEAANNILLSTPITRYYSNQKLEFYVFKRKPIGNGNRKKVRHLNSNKLLQEFE